MTTWLARLAAAVTLAACAAPPPGGDPTGAPDDDPAPELDGVPDGTHGWARVKTPHGIERLPYVASNNHAIYEGDMDLGPISRVDERLRGGALTSTGTRWTNDVQYAFNPSFTGASRTAVRDAIAGLEARIPINFHEVTYGQQSGPWIELKWSPETSQFAGMSTAVGMMGCGEIHCSSFGECRTDCGQWIYFNPSYGEPSASTTKHEILHALGLYHEQARNDRDSFISYHPECLASDAAQFAKQSSSEDLGPYDYASIMHYNSSAFCMKNPGSTSCVCRPMTKLVDADGNGSLDSIFPASDLTREDVNTMWRAYNRSLGVNSEGDALGQALAVADFDGDGYDDVAIGAPGNDGGGEGAGAVFVFKGTSYGLVPWHALTQSATPNDVIEAGDHFGAALAAADIDGDGKAELLIGVPDEDFGSVADVGEVHVFRGSPSGPVFDHTLTQADGGGTNEASDRFGAAIAIGKLTGGSVPDIAIGAPGDRNSGFLGTAKSGAVYVLHEDPTVLFSSFQPTRLARLALTGDNFGATLAIGKIDGDGNADLAVGAPGHGGSVYVYAGRTPPELSSSWSEMATYRQTIVNPDGGNDDRFGAALVIANVSGSSTGELVAGAPGVSAAVGRVYIYNLAAASLAVTAPMALVQTLFSNGAQEAGDEFGAALAAFPRDPSTVQLELVVGSPGENSNTGIITLYRGELAGVTQPLNVFQSAIPGEANEAGDRFGAALAAGQLDGAGSGGSSDSFFTSALRLTDLAVGAPGERLFASGNLAAGDFGYFLQGAAGAMIGRASYDQQYEHRE
jgi:hypothetical protein